MTANAQTATEAHRCKVLVTGASGFIGTHVVRHLAEVGHEPLPMVRTPECPQALLPFSSGLRRASLEDDAALQDAVEGADIIVHLGGLTRARSEAEFAATNGEGVTRLMRAVRARAPGLRRFIYVSSLSAGGPSDGAVPVREDEKPRPVSAYGRSKLLGERRLREEAGPVPWTILRPPIVYGPGERDLFTMFKAARRGIVPLLGFAERWYSIVHVSDLAAAIAKVATLPAAAGATYYVAEPRAYSGRDLALLIGAALGKAPRILRVPHFVGALVAASGSLLKRFMRRAPIVTLDKMPELVRSWVCSPDRIARECDVRTRITFADGAIEAAAWYREQGWL
jgi:nucleoside-diphosphate-sugar epimerase